MLVAPALIAGCLMLQGCLAGAWVAVVGLDSSRTADVTFAPFEHSWVAQQREGHSSSPAPVRTIAIVPFEGDAIMSTRLARVLTEHTEWRVVSTGPLPESQVHALAEESAGDLGKGGRERVVRAVTHELGVDSILIGHVQTLAGDPAAWGWKEREERRLYLYLIDQTGAMLWKDELPFTVVKGTKPPLEEAVRDHLAEHLITHASAMGLKNWGFTPRRPAS